MSIIDHPLVNTHEYFDYLTSAFIRVLVKRDSGWSRIRRVAVPFAVGVLARTRKWPTVGIFTGTISAAPDATSLTRAARAALACILLSRTTSPARRSVWWRPSETNIREPIPPIIPNTAGVRCHETAADIELRPIPDARESINGRAAILITTITKKTRFMEKTKDKERYNQKMKL